MGLANWLKKTEINRDISVVLGNESGDLDSVASSLCYAFLLKERFPIVPVLNFPRTSLSIRKELLFLLERIGLDPSQLSFKEDLPHHPKSMFLVDHHRLAPDQERYAPFVVGILDHHPGEVPAYPSLQTCRIATCGSTATLVEEEGRGREWPSDCALLLASAILLDTQALRNPEKTTERDREAISRLLPLAGIEEGERFYEKLHDFKISLTPEEALRKDLKRYRSGALAFAIASLPEGIAISDSLAEQFRNELQLPALFLFQPFSHEKRLTLYCHEPNLREAIGASLPFSLLEMKEGVSVFSVPLKLSRKLLAPKLDFTSKLIQELIK